MFKESRVQDRIFYILFYKQNEWLLSNLYVIASLLMKLLLQNHKQMSKVLSLIFFCNYVTHKTWLTGVQFYIESRKKQRIIFFSEIRPLEKTE